MSWYSAKIGPWEGLQAATDTVETFAGTAGNVLQIIKTTIELLARLEVKRGSIVQSAAVQVKRQLDEYLTSLYTPRAYALYVPPQRKLVMHALMKEALDKTQLVLPSSFDPSVLQIKTQVYSQLISRNPAAARLLQTNSGGNAGYLNTIVESLADQGDSNRPQLKDTDWVCGVHLLAGAPDYVTLLNYLPMLLSFVPPPASATALDFPEMPRAKGLRSRTVPFPGGVAVRLDWEQPPMISFVPTADLRCRVDMAYVVRSTDPALCQATSVYSMLPGITAATAKKGYKSGAAEIIAELVPYVDGVAPSYTDADVVEGATYFYAVFLKVSSGGTTDVFSPLTVLTAPTGVEVAAVKKATARSSSGTPPDWVTHRRALDAIPALEGVVHSVHLFLRTLAEFADAGGGSLGPYAKFLQQELDILENLVKHFAAQMSRLGALANASQAGVFANIFSGRGGTPFFIRDLAESLAGKTVDGELQPVDENAPPFYKDEFVAGVVLLIASPTFEEMSAVKKTLELLFRGSTETSIVQSAIRQIEDELATLEEADEPEFAEMTFPQVGTDDDGTLDC